MPEFGTAFGDADEVQVLDIYAASEQPIEGVSGQSLAAVMQKNGGRVEYASSMKEAVERLAKSAKPGDMVLTMGAGNVVQASGMLLEELKGRQ